MLVPFLMLNREYIAGMERFGISAALPVAPIPVHREKHHNAVPRHSILRKGRYAFTYGSPSSNWFVDDERETILRGASTNALLLPWRDSCFRSKGHEVHLGKSA